MAANNKIRSAYPTLPYAEKKVADFILDNPDRAIRMVINEIAAEAGVSVPSVTRLARRLGYNGFLDFRVALAGGAADNAATQKLAPIGDDDDEYAVIDKLYGYNIMSLEDTYRTLDKDALIKVAREIATKKRVLVCGEWEMLTKDIVYGFNTLEMEAIPLYEEAGMHIYRTRYTKDDVLLAYSRTGRSRDIYDQIICANAAGATTVYISSYPNNQTAQVCNYFFNSFNLAAAKTPFKFDGIATTTMINVIMTLVAKYKGHNITGVLPKRK